MVGRKRLMSDFYLNKPIFKPTNKRKIKEEQKKAVEKCSNCKIKYSEIDNLCSKCDSNFTKCSDFAKDQGGKARLCLLNNSKVEYECAKGHVWLVSYAKSTQRWCATCNAQSKKNWRKQVNADQKKQVEFYSDVQEQLFKEARERMNQKLFENEELLARAQTDKDMSELGDDIDSSFSQDEAYHVNWLLQSTQKSLEAFFSQFDRAERSRQYKSLAKKIHPDKNSHPRATEAMSKLSSFYESFN